MSPHFLYRSKSMNVTSHCRIPSLQQVAVLAILCSAMSAVSCSTPGYSSDHKPKSRKTARQVEHYEKTYGGPPVLGQPSPSSMYQPRAEASKPFTTLR